LETVSPDLLQLITELQSLKTLESFALAGGTNLSIRYNHRQSIDIDLFTNKIVGINGLRAIEKELRESFKENLIFLNIDDPGCGEQYCFIKSLIRKNNCDVKVEILQNIQLLKPIEIKDNVRLISVIDIGVMKLETVSNRKAQKDVYDIERITDDIELSELMNQLKIKKERFSEEHYKSLFDLDDQQSPLDNPIQLLSFDDIKYEIVARRPSHTDDKLRINEGGKSWLIARVHWKRKVSKYCTDHNIELPEIKPIN